MAQPVQLENGEFVVTYKCPKCKHFHRKGTRNRYLYLDTTCDTCGVGLSNWQARPSAGIFFTKAEFLMWEDRGDGGHKCDGRCLSAKGPNCECKCHGQNHGAGNHGGI